MENQNKQRDVERELKELVQKYNVLDKSQLYAYFEKDGRERFVGRALKVQIQNQNYTRICPLTAGNAGIR